jgi:hypothetical protein
VISTRRLLILHIVVKLLHPPVKGFMESCPFLDISVFILMFGTTKIKGGNYIKKIVLHSSVPAGKNYKIVISLSRLTNDACYNLI